MVLNRIYTGCAIIVFLSLFLSGFQITLDPIKIVPFDMAAFVFSILFITVFLRLRIRITGVFLEFSLIAFLLIIWHFVQVLQSVDVLRAGTLLIILMRDIVIADLIAVAVQNHILRKNHLHLSFFVIPVLITFLTLPFFVAVVVNPERVVAEPYPALIYRAGEGLFPHFKGLNHNPIYFATLVLLSTFVGIFVYITEIPRKMWAKLGLFVLLTAFLMTFQRGPIVVSVVGIVAITLFLLPYPTLKRSFQKYLRDFLVIFAVLSLILLGLRPPSYDLSLSQRLLYRFQRSNWNLRFDRWSYILSDAGEISWIFGHGLRGAEALVGGMFVENSYLEVLYDQGIVGLVLWMMLFVYILIIGIKKLKKDKMILPWCLGWLLILLSMGYVSMHYDPLTWVIAGVIVGWRLDNKPHRK